MESFASVLVENRVVISSLYVDDRVILCLLPPSFCQYYRPDGAPYLYSLLQLGQHSKR